MNVNKAIVLGRVTRDPEVKQLDSGTSIANFSIATNRYYTDKSGQKQEEVEFHNIVFWGKQAEIIGKYVNKGALLFVEGELKTRSWEKDNVKHYRTEIVGRNFQLPPKALSGQSDQSDQSDPVDTSDENIPVVENDVEEDLLKDIPF